MHLSGNTDTNPVTSNVVVEGVSQHHTQSANIVPEGAGMDDSVILVEPDVSIIEIDDDDDVVDANAPVAYRYIAKSQPQRLR